MAVFDLRLKSVTYFSEIIMYQSIQQRVSQFLSDESGPTAVEYAVMLALILGLCLVGIGALGIATLDMWTGNSNDINTFLSN